MYTTKLRKVGGSVMLAIPPAFLDVLRLHAGAAVALSVDDGQLVVEPQVRPRYTLDELELLRLGPMSIKRRVRTLGGEMVLDSKPGQGAGLKIRLAT